MGVRRYQNEDGTLTDLGRKRLEAAANEARKYASDYRKNAEDYKEHMDSYKSKYFDKGKFRADRYLTDAYGNDWKDPEYMKTVFEVSNLEEHAKALFDEDFGYFQSNYNDYIEEAKAWEESAKTYMSATSLDDLDDYMLMEMESLAEEYLRNMK